MCPANACSTLQYVTAALHGAAPLRQSTYRTPPGPLAPSPLARRQSPGPPSQTRTRETQPQPRASPRRRPAPRLDRKEVHMCAATCQYLWLRTSCATSPTLHKSPPPRGLDVCCPPLRLTLRRCFRAALATRRTHEAHRPAPEHGRALLGRGLHASKHRNRRAVGGRATRPSAPAKHAAEPREPWPTARAAAPQGWAWLA